MEIKESAEESEPECSRKVEKLPKDTSEKLGDHPRLKRKETARERAEKDCFLDYKETSIANDVQPLDMRSSTREHLKVNAEAEGNPELSDSAGVEKEESVFDGFLGLLSGSPQPPDFTSFPTGIRNSTFKQGP